MKQGFARGSSLLFGSLLDLERTSTSTSSSPELRETGSKGFFIDFIGWFVSGFFSPL